MSPDDVPNFEVSHQNWKVDFDREVVLNIGSNVSPDDMTDFEVSCQNRKLTSSGMRCQMCLLKLAIWGTSFEGSSRHRRGRTLKVILTDFKVSSLIRKLY